MFLCTLLYVLRTHWCPIAFFVTYSTHVQKLEITSEFEGMLDMTSQVKPYEREHVMGTEYS